MIKCYVLHKSNLVCLFVSYIFIRIQLCFYVNVRDFSDIHTFLFITCLQKQYHYILLHLTKRTHIVREIKMYTTNTLGC